MRGSISDPIRLFDCVMPCAGAEAFLVMSRQRAEALGLPYVRVRSTCERHNAFPDDRDSNARRLGSRQGAAIRGGGGRARRHRLCPDLRRLSGDVDHSARGSRLLPQRRRAGVHPPASLSRPDGTFPINTSGGQLSVGQAGCAAGFLGLVESIRQLTDRNLARAGTGRALRNRGGLRHDYL